MNLLGFTTEVSLIPSLPNVRLQFISNRQSIFKSNTISQISLKM